ncbi:protein translocase subunit SecD [Bacteriovoracaceae bacterium]|nr:protein translocase subunit SecD [Bacteriovoracaceae bacterium]
MKRDWWYRFIFLLAVFFISAMVVIPTAFNFTEKSNFPVKSKINLGLDLQGGLYIVLGIDFKKVYRDEVKNYAGKLDYFLKDKGIGSRVGTLNIDQLEDPRHTIVIDKALDVEKAKAEIKDFYSYPLRLTKETGTTLEYGLGKTYKTEIEKNAISKSIEVIRNRIDEFGVTEPEIVSMGTDKVVIQLPGVKDIERAKDLIGKTAKLEFQFVNDKVAQSVVEGWVKKVEDTGIVYKKGQRFSEYLLKLNQSLKKELPPGHEIVFQKIVNKSTGDMTSKVAFLVETGGNLTGDDLQDARVSINQEENRPYVAINFKPTGAKVFAELTEKNVGRRMAIILDGNVYSDPVIRERIGGGSASISMGAGGYEDVLSQSRDLALILRAGALPVELEFQEQRIVGPSLGADSISKARLAGLIGATLVFLFIIFWYKVAGMIAVATLLVNILIVLGCLVGLEATLTLPGIAGIALTIGMAVDANIIIYERIKEELALGAPKLQAVEAGFSKAFWTILDANLTTAVAGLCLLNFGTGPIRGFAVTLIIGILATVYSSYFVGGLLFEFYMNKVKGKELSI